MVIESPDASFAAALVELAHHERAGRFAMLDAKLPPFTTDRQALDYVLVRRAVVVARILAARPVLTIRGRFDADDVRSMIYGDGRTLPDWLAHIERDEPDKHAFVARLVAANEPIGGPLLFAAQTNDARSDIIAPIVVFDGYHRVGAWYRAGCSHSFVATVVLTKNPPLGR